MALKKTTVMVEEEYLQIVKEAAAREGRPESEYFREAFRIAALHARRWSGDWDIPALDFGGPLTEDDVREAIDEAVNRKNGTTGIAT
ncbi:CopG family transcriptional regulator [Protofrankia coriariae]|uniref:CopG family transcriptional regulator n=2 Tax=Protofrankia TaxID=2994361 RepID=A0ABR5EYZ3_9ACTN|nr:CopG family transcriptional regulator [Protofrankia coriariae]KLL09674.1 CopG family transcriptional regulator [Protofrankia coriariae]ONH32538.1 CopG family transcriptional regulator [Protofrankia sp. BMG5.30]